MGRCLKFGHQYRWPYKSHESIGAPGSRRLNSRLQHDPLAPGQSEAACMQLVMVIVTRFRLDEGMSRRSFRTVARVLGAILSVAFLVSPAFAQGGRIDGADTAWMIVATSIVLMMTIPGLAL